MTARNGSEARAVARGAAAATGANPALRSVVLNLCARHGARRILWIGPGGEPLGRALRQAGYAVGEMDAGGHRPTARADFASASPAGAAGIHPDPSPAEVRFDLALSTESPEPFAALDARVALAADRLRPGGLFLLSTPYRGALKSRIAALCDRWRPRRDRSRGDSPWSKPRLKQLLESHGFVLAELIGVRDTSLQLKTVVWVARQGGRLPAACDG